MLGAVRLTFVDQYRYLGQLLEGEEALAALQKGVVVLQTTINSQVWSVGLQSWPMRIICCSVWSGACHASHTSMQWHTVLACAGWENDVVCDDVTFAIPYALDRPASDRTSGGQAGLG